MALECRSTNNPGILVETRQAKTGESMLPFSPPEFSHPAMLFSLFSSVFSRKISKKGPKSENNMAGCGNPGPKGKQKRQLRISLLRPALLLREKKDEETREVPRRVHLIGLFVQLVRRKGE